MKYNKAYYHNEIELIKVNNTDLKNKIEKTFLRNRISYFIRWEKPTFWQSLFGNHKPNQCKICINEWDKEVALELLKEFESAIAGQGELLLKKTEPTWDDSIIDK